MADEKKQIKMTTQEVGEVITLMERIRNFVSNNGLKGSFSTLLLLFVVIIMGYFAMNPSVMFEKYEKFTTEKHNNAITARLEADPQIREALYDLRENIDADRTFIIEAHNGGTNLTNLPFLYVDMTYESTNNAMIQIEDEYKNVRLQRYIFSSYVYENNYWFGNVEEMEEIDPIFYYRLLGDDVNKFGLLVIYGETNIIGAIGVEYIDDTEVDEKFIKQQMLKCGSKISILLSNENNKKK